MFAFKIPIDFVSIPCGLKFLRFTSAEVPILFLNAYVHFCSGGDVHLRLREIRAFTFAMKARELQHLSSKDERTFVCVHVCSEPEGQGKERK